MNRDGGDIDQLTGATISPRAVSGAVEKGLIWFKDNRDAVMDAAAGAKPVTTSGETS